MIMDIEEPGAALTGVVDAEELAAVIHINPKTVRRLARSRAIPSYRVGRLLRFDVARVMAVLKTAEWNGRSVHAA